MGEAFDVFGEGNDVAQIVVLLGVEDGVVDYDAIDGGVGVGGEDGVFDGFAGDAAELEGETTDVMWSVHRDLVAS